MHIPSSPSPYAQRSPLISRVQNMHYDAPTLPLRPMNCNAHAPNAPPRLPALAEHACALPFRLMSSWTTYNFDEDGGDEDENRWPKRNDTKTKKRKWNVWATKVFPTNFFFNSLRSIFFFVLDALSSSLIWCGWVILERNKVFFFLVLLFFLSRSTRWWCLCVPGGSAGASSSRCLVFAVFCFLSSSTAAAAAVVVIAPSIRQLVFFFFG